MMRLYFHYFENIIFAFCLRYIITWLLLENSLHLGGGGLRYFAALGFILLGDPSTISILQTIHFHVIKKENEKKNF